MPSGDRFMSNLFSANANKATVRARAINHLEATSLQASLNSDAADLYYSAWVSFVDAIRGIQVGFYTWSIVKLYYSTFYCFRASLALDGICLFYVNRTHYTVRAAAGSQPKSCDDPGSHKPILNIFGLQKPTPILFSQTIELQTPSDWLMAKREKANYKLARFEEPDCPSILKFIADIGVRKATEAYLSQKDFLYVFDPDHAIVAYPLKALEMTGSKMKSFMPPISYANANVGFLHNNVKDKNGVLAGLLSAIKKAGI